MRRLERGRPPNHGKDGIAPLGASVGREDLALRHCEWLASAIEAQQRLAPELHRVPRMRDLVAEDFLPRFYARRGR